MVATLSTPNVAARTLSASLKRTISAKAVRTMARTTIKRFEKASHPEYQSHAYTTAEMASLRKSFAARTPRAVAQPVRKPRTRKPVAATVKPSDA